VNKLCILSLFRLVLVRRFKRKINLSPFELTQFLEIIWFSLKFQMFLFKCGILSQALLRYAGMTFIDPYNLHVILKRISRQMHLLVSVNNSFSWSVICSKSSFGHVPSNDLLTHAWCARIECRMTFHVLIIRQAQLMVDLDLVGNFVHNRSAFSPAIRRGSFKDKQLIVFCDYIRYSDWWNNSVSSILMKVK
jgi:hypothetical protein